MHKTARMREAIWGTGFTPEVWVEARRRNGHAAPHPVSPGDHARLVMAGAALAAEALDRPDDALLARVVDLVELRAHAAFFGETCLELIDCGGPA